MAVFYSYHYCKKVDQPTKNEKYSPPDPVKGFWNPCIQKKCGMGTKAWEKVSILSKEYSDSLALFDTLDNTISWRQKTVGSFDD